MVVTLRSARVVLRDWRDEDLDDFAALNADAEVMRYFPSVLTRAESDALATRARTFLHEHGWGPWAAEHDGRFIGFVGLSIPHFDADFMPAVELLWRLARHAQGKGLATEAAREVLAWARVNLPGRSLVSFTTVDNRASRRVMEKLGLTESGEFMHPSLPAEHHLARHVLYRFLER